MTKYTSDRNLPSSSVVFTKQQHTIPQTILLHLLPGALITAFFFLAAPVLI